MWTPEDALGLFTEEVALLWGPMAFILFTMQPLKDIWWHQDLKREERGGDGEKRLEAPRPFFF